MTTTAEPSTDARRPEHARLDELIDGILARRDPATTDAAVIWGEMFDAGLAWVHFPEGKGGLGLDAEYQEYIDRRFADAGVESNIRFNMMGVGMAGPTLVACGTEEQQDEHLRRIYTVEDVWCQMFSEPGAGSDVAGLSTRAVRDGDEWVVNGQKVWTTQAHVAAKGLLLVRTDPDAPKHKGLSYFWIDLHSPGVDVRPLRQLTGAAEFNEIYFTDVRVPDSNRIGDVGAGWNVAITTLMNERTMLGKLADPSRAPNLGNYALDLWRRRGLDDPVLRDRLMEVWVDDAVVRLLMQRAEQNRKLGTPGPESSLGKISVSPQQQRTYKLCIDLLGAEGMLIDDYEMRRPDTVSESILGGAPADACLQKTFLEVQGATIGGGTSEISRNIIGERVLGLPKEPSVDRDLPWSEIPRS
ncbi:MAG: acyl-CoA dehydrogenase family protein [Acidimicrobiia bacterium]